VFLGPNIVTVSNLKESFHRIVSYRRLRKLISSAILPFFLLTGCRRSADKTTYAQSDSNRDTAIDPPQSLTSEGQASRQQYVDAANLPDLRWPNFANDQKEVREFYAAFPASFPWVADGKPTPQALAIIQALKNAQFKGLAPEDYDASRWDTRLNAMAQSRPASEIDLVRFDLALTVSTMRYVSDLHIGRVNPRLFHFDLEIDHTEFDLSEFLRKELVGSQNVQSALESVEPPFPVYHRTEVALKQYLELPSRDDGQSLSSPKKPVKPGDSYPDLPRLISVLTRFGDLPSNYDETSERYVGAVVDGVKHFQTRHGLDPSGVIDAPTIRELNVPVSKRINQLALTMERIRWLPHEFARPPIVVNIPEFRLHADDENFHWILSMKVVVGGSYHHQTPVFASEIRAVIFRPYWDVPSSILQQELLAHIGKNPNYLVENSYEVVDKSGSVVSEGIVNDAILQGLRAGTFRVRQTPGPTNSLGLLKFDIPSVYDVYMHDTPATELFLRSRRDFSHGCIRVQDPVRLAAWVLRDMPEWNEDAIRSAMNGDDTLRVKLEKPIPVLVLYSTAVVMEDGDVHFFDDIYGLDAELARALQKGYPYTGGAESPAGQ
jgi:L,D-transpeptidase YcbB